MKKVSQKLIAALIASAIGTSAFAAAVRPGFSDTDFARNDDGSISVALPFSINFFGTTYGSVFLNNNGNITFTGALSTFTPFAITGGSTPMIAPFFADVDTRSAGNPTRYGSDTVGGRAAFGFDWIDVDYFASSAAHTNRNSFQLVLIDRSDVGVGDFDFEFNYDQVQWETGTASGGNSSGLGGSCAHAGWTNGAGVFQELAGSGACGAFLDGGVNALSRHSLNSTEPGRYLFQVRNGTIVTVPEPTGIALVGLGLAGLAAIRRRKIV